MFGPSTAAAFLTQRGTLAEVSTTASHLRPSSALRSSLSRSPCNFSRSGNRPGWVLPRLNRVTLYPRRSAASTVCGPRKPVPPSIRMVFGSGALAKTLCSIAPDLEQRAGAQADEFATVHHLTKPPRRLGRKDPLPMSRFLAPLRRFSKPDYAVALGRHPAKVSGNVRWFRNLTTKGRSYYICRACSTVAITRAFRRRQLQVRERIDKCSHSQELPSWRFCWVRAVGQPHSRRQEASIDHLKKSSRSLTISRSLS